VGQFCVGDTCAESGVSDTMSALESPFAEIADLIKDSRTSFGKLRERDVENARQAPVLTVFGQSIGSQQTRPSVLSKRSR